jgi:hypothetical protein
VTKRFRDLKRICARCDHERGEGVAKVVEFKPAELLAPAGFTVLSSLAERLERIRQKKAEADTDMLSLLEELVKDVISEKEARESLGLSERAQGFLTLAKTHAGDLPDEKLIELSRQVDEIVTKNASFPEWAERDDVLRDIRKETIKLVLADDATKSLVSSGFIDEALQVAAAREGAAA